MPTDLAIAKSATLLPITDIAEQLGLDPTQDIEGYGKGVAKVSLDVLDRLPPNPNARYIDVTAITPTPLGEGKTTVAIGLGQGMGKIGKRGAVTIRQPSQGPTFGIKGGAAGGGYSQVVPMDKMNLHLTGDIHAITAAHNLIAAMLDAHIYHGNELNIDTHRIPWKRVVDLNDRALRNVVIGLGKRYDGVPRESKFEITVASEIMACLALATSLQDLRARIGRMVIAYDRDFTPITADDLKAAGAATVLLIDAIRPNLMQTLENTPVFVHCGPFANIAHGNSSILADKIALRCADYVITESGFGADVGAEKFFNIKSRMGGLQPNAVVLVATIRALKAHTGKYKIIPGKPLDAGLVEENPADVELGCDNLVRHIENVRKFGLQPVVAINQFTNDTEAEMDVVRRIADEAGAYGVATIDCWGKGGDGSTELAEMVVSACEADSDFRYLYDTNDSITQKLETIAKEIYRADGLDIDSLAQTQIKRLEGQGFGDLPVCIAKTPLSFSHSPKLGSTPSGFDFPIREVQVSAGAGFIYALAGNINTMPGLGRTPAAHNIDIDENGEIVGLA